jgi:hypothetical protein
MVFKKGHPIYSGSEKGQFKKGNSGHWLGKKRPNIWNGSRPELKGKHLAPNTEFKEGIEVWNKGLTPRKEKYYNPTTRINGRQVLQSHKVWCESNQLHRIPKGIIVHHLDNNPKNNKPENLQLLENKYHHKFHTTMQQGMR